MIQRFFFMRHDSYIERFERKKLIFKYFNKMTVIIMPITNIRFNKMLQYYNKGYKISTFLF